MSYYGIGSWNLCAAGVSSRSLSNNTLPCRAYELRNYSRLLFCAFIEMFLLKIWKRKNALHATQKIKQFSVHACHAFCIKCKNEQVCVKFHWIHMELQPQSMNLFWDHKEARFGSPVFLSLHILTRPQTRTNQLIPGPGCPSQFEPKHREIVVMHTNGNYNHWPKPLYLHYIIL